MKSSAPGFGGRFGRFAIALGVVPAALFAACGDDGDVGPAPVASTTSASTSSGSGGAAELPGTFLEADEQRPGDPAAGYTALVNEGYVSCGLPWSVYSLAAPPVPDEHKLPGRAGKNEDLPYYQTAFTTASDVEVVSLNCLVCHASTIQGELVVGLGTSSYDFTNDQSTIASAVGNFITDPEEHAEWEKWAQRVIAISPYVQTTTIGVNPADNLAAVLFSHRDPQTLAWSEEPKLALPPEYVVPVDVPPWWHMQKKNAMFYVGGGRGDHARIMMTASTLCTDTVAEAQAIDAYFPDIRAYIASIEAPAYPGSIDVALAEEGKALFETTCSQCHGTYGAEETYPNLLISLEDIGTDPNLATGANQFADIYVQWFESSFYGEIADLAPQDGYVAPPLDGIWATGPYFHNGSVPTVAGVLDSQARPTYWRRTFADDDLDLARLGWNYTEPGYGKAGAANATEAKAIYDTTELGYSNTGHTFGDGFSDAQRAAVIEYLKTL